MPTKTKKSLPIALPVITIYRWWSKSSSDIGWGLTPEAAIEAALEYCEEAYWEETALAGEVQAVNLSGYDLCGFLTALENYTGDHSYGQTKAGVGGRGTTDKQVAAAVAAIKKYDERSAKRKKACS